MAQRQPDIPDGAAAAAAAAATTTTTTAAASSATAIITTTITIANSSRSRGGSESCVVSTQTEGRPLFATSTVAAAAVGVRLSNWPATGGHR